jgi:hypothetical protein
LPILLQISLQLSLAPCEQFSLRPLNYSFYILRLVDRGFCKTS